TLHPGSIACSSFNSFCIRLPTDQIDDLFRSSLTYIYSRFGADDPVLLKRRHHNYLNFIASLTMALSDTWSVIPEVRYTDNKSSLQTSEYDRVEFTLRFRGRF
ncbi:MAG TPA: hypothetical protein QF901_00135, partial [Gammaproteobacteria bacterium]|nr:hypothetical protein [Gammaproteobacteria bacterium]